MKRGHYDHGGGHGGPKRSRGGASSSGGDNGNKFEVRLLVPSKVAGSIIGKGGANIQKLRNDNDATVRIPDCPGPERVMTIQTHDSDTAVTVLKQSLPFMTEEAVRGGPGSVPVPDGPQELRLLIHQSIVGGIIGRAGFKIKEIRDASGANIKVYQSCAPQSSDRCVSIQGTVDKLVLALKEVFQVMLNTEIKGMDQAYDPNNFDLYYANEYGGYGGEMDCGSSYGRDGGSGGGHRSRGNRDGEFRSRYGRNGGGGGGGRRAGGYGGGGGGGGYQDFGGGNFGDGFNGRRAGRGAYGGGATGDYSYDGYGGVGDDGYNQGSVVEDTGEIETTQVTIPKDMAGAIIGPGGSRIRKIRSDSKANITIDEPLPGSSERIITIAGTDRQIQTAQYLLQQSVRDHSGQNVGVTGGYTGGQRF